MRRAFLGGVAFAIVALSRTAFAAGASDLEAVLAEPVVSGASDKAEDDSVAPATITTITSDDLRRYGIQTLDQAINFLSLGMVTQDNMDGPEIGARGVLLTGDYGNHVLLLLNGHAMNEQWDGTAYYGRGTAIPMELVDHIEVIVGPGSVLYGTNAMLGVINVVTKAAKDFKGFHVIGEMDFGGSQNTQDFAATTFRIGAGFGHEFQLGGKHAEITGELEYFTRSGPSFFFGSENYGSDYVTGNGKCFDKLKPDGTCAGTPGYWPPVDPSAKGAYADKSYYQMVPSGYVRMVWGNWELDVRAALFKRSYPYEFGLWNNGNDSFEVDRWVSGDLKNRWQISPIAQLRSRLYGDSYDYFETLPSYAPEDCLGGQNSGCLYTLRGAAVWGGIEEQLVLDWLKDNTLTTLLGIDERVRFRGQRTDSTDIITGDNPGSVTAFGKIDNVFAAYLQQTWSPFKWLGLNGGGRLDVYEGFGAQVSPRAALSIKPWDKGTLKAVYSEAFRAPTAYEQLDADGVVHIANQGLKPETVRSVEGSFEQRFGQNRIMVGGFASWWQNLITFADLSQAQIDDAISKGLLPTGSTAGTQYQNVDSLSNYGFNARFEGSAFHRDLRYALNVTGAWTRKDANAATGTPEQILTVAPQLFGNARISYDLPGDAPVLAVAASLVGKRPADKAFNSSTDSTTGSTINWAVTPWAPTQLDLRFTVSGPVPKVKGLSYRLIADYAVTPRGPYVVGPVTTPYSPDTSAQLIPVDQFRATVGLQYDIR